MSIAIDKLDRMVNGEKVITNDAELDEMLATERDEVFRVRSRPHPMRVSMLDQYVAWIDAE